MRAVVSLTVRGGIVAGMAEPQEAGELVAALSQAHGGPRPVSPLEMARPHDYEDRAVERIFRWAKRGFFQHGNDPRYLTGRIARERPDILERMRAGEFRSVRQAAIAAGIVKGIPAEDAGTERLFTAWRRATPEDRLLFLWALEEEIEAIRDGEDVTPRSQPPRKGPAPYRKREGEMGVPEVEALIDRGWSVSGLAREIGVTYRTLSRWRWGETKPNQAQRERLSQLTLLAVTGEDTAQRALGPAEGAREGPQ